MDGDVRRDIGPTLLLPVGLAVLGCAVLWGVSGAVVGATVLTISGCVAVATERREPGLLGRATEVPAAWAAVIGEPEFATSAPEAISTSDSTPELRVHPIRLRAASIPRWGRISALTAARSVIVGAVVAMALVYYLRDVGANPAGLFCDEAEIGLEAYRLVHGRAETTSMPFFYQHFGYGHMGALPLFATAPFVGLFGADDFGVRLASVGFMLATLAVIYATLRRLQTPYALVAVTLFAFSPVVIHLSRVNFGHTPAMFCLASGYLMYVWARQERRWAFAIAAGVLLGLSAYGNASFYVITPMFLGAIALSEIAFNWSRVREYGIGGLTLLFGFLWLTPFGYRALTDDVFWRRLREKDLSDAPLLSWARFDEILHNYPKYFSFDYLFETGEVGLPGGWLTRHSVKGAGELSVVALPVLLFGALAIFFLIRDPQTRFFLPFLVLAVLYPLPDLLTTSDDRPPYTLAVFGSSLCVPYLAGSALRGIHALASTPTRGGYWPFRTTAQTSTSAGPRDDVRSWRTTLLAPSIAGTLLAIVVISGWRFYTGPYARYPHVSADYWGWQYGPRQMIAYYLDHEAEYDEFIMDGHFNEAYVFLDFYIRDPEARRKASIGDLGRLDLSKRQLFGVRSEVWNRLPGSQVPSKSYMTIDQVIRYPNGEDVIYLVKVRPEVMP